MLQDLIDQTLAAPLAAARQRADQGGRVIGLFGSEIPTELVLAADAFPLQLPAGAPRPTPDADRYLERGFSTPARLMLQDWIDGRLDVLEAVVFTRANDNAQRLYYYVCELKRRGLLAGPEPLLYDLAKIDRPTSAAHNRSATLALATRLGATDLAGAIERVDRRRRLFARIGTLRPAATGPVVDQLCRAAGAAEFDAFDAALEAFIDALAEPATGPRLLFLGSVPPDDRFHTAVAAAGGQIVAELYDMGLDRYGPPIGAADDAIAAIAGAYHALALGTRSFADRAALVVEAAGAARADGVIVWLVEEEEALIWDLPAQLRAIETLNLPHLALTRAAWDAGSADLDRVTHFTRAIGETR